jgi:hypothetical protein
MGTNGVGKRQTLIKEPKLPIKGAPVLPGWEQMVLVNDKHL